MSDAGGLLDTLGATGHGSQLYGVVIGVITNNQDPLSLGRVKVRFPWLAELTESAWARVATPMAGKDRGMYMLPEVDDEVLLVFQHGQVDLPVVIGSLWNGKDRPPADNRDGKNRTRMLRSRSGHTVTLDDTEGEEQIAIADASGRNTIVISTRNNSITISADGDLTIESRGGALALRGARVEIEAQSTARVRARAGAEIRAGAELNIVGEIVNIN